MWFLSLQLPPIWPHLALELHRGVGWLVQDFLAGVVEAVRETLEQDQRQKHHLKKWATREVPRQGGEGGMILSLISVQVQSDLKAEVKTLGKLGKPAALSSQRAQHIRGTRAVAFVCEAPTIASEIIWWTG